jgi:hypothetical protein
MSSEDNARYSAKSLTAEQYTRLQEAAALLPEGFSYAVSDDNMHITVKDGAADVACMSYDGSSISGWCETNQKFVNRACEAVWAKKPYWPS